MFSQRVLCKAQQNKIGFFTTLIILSIVGFIGVNVTIVTTNIAAQNRILEKKSNIGQKSSESTKIKKAITAINSYTINKNLKRKNGFYNSFDKQDFLNALVVKMNNEDNLDLLDEINDKKINLEYSGFLVRLNSFSNSKLDKIFMKLKRQLLVSGAQNVNATIDSSIVKVSFNADYEYVAYRVLEMLKQIFPGYFVVKSISVVPVNEDVKRIFYDRKFKNKKIDKKLHLDDRLNCSIEFEWIMLKGDKPKD